MKQQSIKTRGVAARPISHWSWRLGWMVMLLLHAVPITIRTFIAPSNDVDFSPLRFAVLGLLSGFFVLKIIDVPWLRFRTDARATVSWLVIVSLLHLGVLNRVIDESSGPPHGGLQIVLFVGSAVVAASVVSLLYVAVAARAPRRTPPTASFQSHQPWCAIFHSLCWISRTCPRGPPA